MVVWTRASVQSGYDDSKSSHGTFSEVCVFVGSEENTKLANFSVHSGVNKIFSHKKGK